MALSTANTTLKYGICQVETATVVGTITTAGNATVTVTGAGITGSPLAVSVAVALGDTASVIAQKMRVALQNTAAITAVYEVSGAGSDIVLTRKLAAVNDATLNIAVADGTSVGITEAEISVNTKAGTAYAKLSNIVSYPDLGGAPNKIDTTDLTATTMKTSIFGLQEAPDLTFEANYDKAVITAINLLKDMYSFKLEFGTNGADGAFAWDGHVTAFVTGGGVDEPRKLNIVTSAETEIMSV